MNDLAPETRVIPGFPKIKKIPDEIKVILAKPRCKLVVTRDKKTTTMLISQQVAAELISEGFVFEVADSEKHTLKTD
jgi:hypothetical protein